MKRLISLLYLVLPISLFAQSLNENPYLTYYLGPNLQESSVGTIMGRTYDGISKIHLSRNIPSSWIPSYTLNHLPISARHSDFITPFGRSYMSIASGYPPYTSLSFLGSAFGEMDVSLTGGYKLDKKGKVSTNLALNYHHANGKRDKNEDGFLDLNRKKKFIGINTWNFKNDKNFRSVVSAFHLMLDETRGQVDFNKDTDYLTNNNYGLGTKLNHSGVGIQNKWTFKNKNNDNKKGTLVLDAETRISDLTQFYGLNEYQAEEITANAYMGYKLYKGFTDWEFGAHFRHERLKESFADSQLTNFAVSIPGVYVRMQTQLGYRVKLQADIRANYHTNDQFLIHPGLKITYVPQERMALSTFAGNGTRYARAITENDRFLFSNREVSMAEQLNPEKAWHYGLSYRWNSHQSVRIFNDWKMSNFKYYLLFYHNIYQNLNVVDITDNNALVFKNHNGKAFKTSLNNRLSFSPYRNIYFTAMHRFDIFKTDETGTMTERLYYPKHSFMIAMSYRYKSYFSLNTQVHIIGKTPTVAEAYPSGYSPKRRRWDMSVSVPLNQYLGGFDAFKKFDIVLGMDNITNTKTEDIIAGADQPFTNEMDGGIRNGNALGARFYGGLKVNF
ncbi:MAG: outer membrane receptor for ferrienterochelin and colicins [Maribacter sp.]|jgi:outer membrane receptor for ferrienterochelin and colicins